MKRNLKEIFKQWQEPKAESPGFEAKIYFPIDKDSVEAIFSELLCIWCSVNFTLPHFAGKVYSSLHEPFFFMIFLFKNFRQLKERVYAIKQPPVPILRLNLLLIFYYISHVNGFFYFFNPSKFTDDLIKTIYRVAMNFHHLQSWQICFQKSYFMRRDAERIFKKFFKAPNKHLITGLSYGLISSLVALSIYISPFSELFTPAPVNAFLFTTIPLNSVMVIPSLTLSTLNCIEKLTRKPVKIDIMPNIGSLLFSIASFIYVFIETNNPFLSLSVSILAGCFENFNNTLEKYKNYPNYINNRYVLLPRNQTSTQMTNHASLNSHNERSIATATALN